MQINVRRPALGPWGLTREQAGSALSPGIAIMQRWIWEFRHLGRLLREESLQIFMMLSTHFIHQQFDLGFGF